MYDTGELIRIYLLPRDRIDKRVRYHDETSRRAAYLKAYGMIEAAIWS